jgi:RNA polymerase sigma-70 factor (ECF subfamily)
MQSEDQRLVQRLLAGEEAAFNEFFREYFGRLYRFALARVRNEDDARDIVQETLSRAVRKIATYRGEAALFTWLCQVCRSRLSEHFSARQRQTQHVMLAEDDPAVAAALESVQMLDADPELHWTRNEHSRLVQVALDNLPVRYGKVLHWKYVEGIPVQMIAERLGVRHAAAQSLLQRAREAFRDAFTTLSEASAGPTERT